MKRTSLSGRLKAIIICSAICGLVIYGYMLPYIGEQIFPQKGYEFWSFLIFLWISGIPCYAVLMCCWKIAKNIGANRSFSESNAFALKRISTLAAIDAAYMFVGTTVFVALGIAEAITVVVSLIIVFVGIAISIAAAALSHLVLNAAELQEQNDLTI